MATQELGRALGGMGDVIQQVQERDDTIYAEDAYNRLIEKRMEMTRGEQGFVHKKGSDATPEMMKNYNDQFNLVATDITESLQNDNQRAKFLKRSDVANLQFKEDMLRHVTQEKEKFNLQVFGNTLEVEARNAADRYNDANAVKGSLVRIEATIGNESKRSGWSAQKKDKVLFETKSGVHINVIQRALDDKNPSLAKDWYKDHKKEIDPSKRGQIEDLIRSTVLEELSQSVADDMILRKLSERDALKEVEKKYKGEEEKAIKTEVKQRYQDHQSAAEESAWDIYNETNDYKKIPLDILNSMHGKEREALKKYSETKAAGTTIKTERSVYYGLKDMLENDPSKYEKENLMKYSPYLSDTDFKKFADAQIEGPDKEFLRTENMITRQTIEGLGLKWSERYEDTSTGKRVDGMIERLEREYASYQKLYGKYPDIEQMGKISDRLMLKTIDTGWFWSDKKVGIVEIEGVPTDILDELVEKLYQDGINPTEEKIREQYKFIVTELKNRNEPVTDERVLQMLRR